MLGLIEAVLNSLFPLFQGTQDAGERVLVKDEQENGKRYDFPENQGRKKIRFKLWHSSHQKGRGEAERGCAPDLYPDLSLLLLAKAHDNEGNDQAIQRDGFHQRKPDP